MDKYPFLGAWKEAAGMTERGSRSRAIRRIIAERSVDSQEKLLELLRQEGFPTTQATLSRDLKALGIGKIPDQSGGYTYTLPEAEVKPGGVSAFTQDFLRGFVSLEFSGNLGLIKTLPGHAGSVASALDNMRIREVLGTVAGDDTILVVPRNGCSRASMLAALKRQIPGL
jgi:transcriptional regulator of arginine metabolism